jgi:CRP/FNR family transcriptional regulator
MLTIHDSKETDALARHYPILKKMDPKIVQEAFRNARLSRVSAGTSLFMDNQPCHAFPFVLAGKIRVFKGSQNGREITLYTVSCGDVCAITAGCILGHHPYSASAVVEVDCELLTISSEAFEALLSDKDFRGFVFSLFSTRLQDLMILVEAVSFQRLDQRLAALLLSKGSRITRTHQQLADELGTVREIVSRVLKTFSQAGWIRLKREEIVVCNEKGLKKILNENP